MSEVTIPVSRFKREMRKWVRYLNEDLSNIVIITHRNHEAAVLMSEDSYDKTLILMEEFYGKEEEKS